MATVHSAYDDAAEGEEERRMEEMRESWAAVWERMALDSARAERAEAVA